MNHNKPDVGVWVIDHEPSTAWTNELHQVGPYDGFVYAYGGISVDSLSSPLRERGISVTVIGDAFAPPSLQHAILEGHQFARERSKHEQWPVNLRIAATRQSSVQR